MLAAILSHTMCDFVLAFSLMWPDRYFPGGGAYQLETISAPSKKECGPEAIRNLFSYPKQVLGVFN